MRVELLQTLGLICCLLCSDVATLAVVTQMKEPESEGQTTLLLPQVLLPPPGHLGQLHAQLPAAQPCHSMRGEGLHHPLCLFGGTVTALEDVWVRWTLVFTICSSADEDVQPTCSSHQGPLHGLQGSGGDASRLSLHPQPSFHHKPKNSRRVSSTGETGLRPACTTCTSDSFTLSLQELRYRTLWNECV